MSLPGLVTGAASLDCVPNPLIPSGGRLTASNFFFAGRFPLTVVAALLDRPGSRETRASQLDCHLTAMGRRVRKSIP